MTEAEPKRILWLCLAFGWVSYAWLVTGGDFNLLGEDALWRAYNVYALQLLKGDLSVPAGVIGQEGWYVDGKAYMSYGLLPALLRLPLLLFDSLAEVPLGRLLVWLQLGAAVSLLQTVLFQVWRRNQTGAHAIGWPLFLIMSLMLWVNSGTFIIAQSAVLYHEPYASALLLVCVGIYVLVRHYCLESMSLAGAAVMMALCAALCLHARPTMAVSLYLVATVMLLHACVARWRGGTGLRGLWQFCRDAMKVSLLPSLILLVGGLSYLGLNLVRFDTIFFNNAIENYGFFIGGEGYSERLLAMKEHGSFNLKRIPGNAAFYFGGLWDLHSQLIEAANVGFVRKETPIVRLLLLWGAPIALAVFVALRLLVRRSQSVAVFGLAFALCFCAGSLLQLSYATVTYRYAAEMWPPILLLLCWGFATGSFAVLRSVTMKGVLLLSVAASFWYGLTLNSEYRSKWSDIRAFDPAQVQS